MCRQLHTPCRAEADVPVTQTPMMKQYTEIKKQYQDALLFFRLGDFYEMFGEDAQIAAKELEIALTSREAGNAGRIPMCGVPYHAVNSYLDKLVSKGYRVAICEQLEDPKQAKGVVKRDVVRCHLGTFIEGSLRISAHSIHGRSAGWESFGAASLDVSTGQFLVMSWLACLIEDELLRLSPAELVAGSYHLS